MYLNYIINQTNQLFNKPKKVIFAYNSDEHFETLT